MNEIIAALFFFLPAGVANMTPVLANKVPLLNRWKTPVDGYKTFRGKRIFGDHKSWRGIVTGTLLGTLAGLVIPESLMGNVFPNLSWPVFALMSFGALAGDAIKSFFKRQRNHPSGSTWFPFDQIDYIIGGLIALVPFAIPSLQLCLTILIGYFGLHLISTYVGFKLKLKSSPL